MEDEEEVKAPHAPHLGNPSLGHHQVDASGHAAATPGQHQAAGVGVAGVANEMCKLCYENECDAAFIPCGHVTACIKCAGRCNQCPVCRLPYHDIMKIYRQ